MSGVLFLGSDLRINSSTGIRLPFLLSNANHTAVVGRVVTAVHDFVFIRDSTDIFHFLSELGLNGVQDI
jgi:hypothetical protein